MIARKTKKCPSGRWNVQTGGESGVSVHLPSNAPLSRVHCTTGGGGSQDIFSAVKERVSVRECVEFYGYTPNRGGFIVCPFHAERTPSLKLYENGWHCFGCHAGGTVIDFTARLFNLSPMDAVKKLNGDFSLGLSLDRHAPTAAELEAARKRQEEREARRLFRDWKARAVWSLTTAAGMGAAALDKSPDEWTDAETTAVKSRERWNYLADILTDGTDAEQIEILNDWPDIGPALERVLTEGGAGNG